MLKRAAGIVSVIILTLQCNFGIAQELDSARLASWYLADPQTDSVQGVSAEKAYQTLLAGKPSTTVLVAVIDSGVDIDHEDLKDVIWTNEDEVPGNNIDDDKNGYVDDVHGWSFLGGKNGNVQYDTYEVTREYARLRPIYESIDEKKVSKKQKEEYAYWKKVKAKYDNDSNHSKTQLEQFTKQYEMYINAFRTIQFCDSVLEKTTGKPVSKSSLSSIQSENDTVNFAKQTLTNIFRSTEGDFTVKEFISELNGYLDQLQEAVDHYKVAVEYGYNTEYNSRNIIGDNAADPNEKNYGSNDVEGPFAQHGTHVSGIIAANRNNGIGSKGIADNVKIMPVRAVPNGDERDKDIANAIRYAADNGARIINMSFGKSFSPDKDVVDKAVKYAESKGVLFIHGAGNDSDDLDIKDNFPNKAYKKGGIAGAWLEIGASSSGTSDAFVASFSNYGKKSVDLFAPGVEIYSTVPDNKYEFQQGTSMAAPATTGVAAMLLSYFPSLTAVQVRDILRQSTRKFDNLKVIKPGTQDEVNFSDLSSSGGVVNAYEAVKLAMTYKQQSAAK